MKQAPSSRLSSSFILGWMVLLLICSLRQGAMATLVGGSRARLPMSLSSVISDLEAEGVTHVTCACLLTSRGITKPQRKQLLHDLFNVFGGEDEYCLTAFGTQPAEDDVEGLAIAHPDPSTSSANDVASTAVACGGTIVYVPHAVDLMRGEGLFDTLAPAMERLLSTSSSDIKSSTLVVIVPPEMDVDTARAKLEQAAASILSSLVITKKERTAVRTLSDVFDKVQYLSKREASDGSLADLLHGLECECEPAEAAAAVASTVDLMTSFVSSLPTDGFFVTNALTTSPRDLAAARQLGPAARSSLDKAMQAVETAIANRSGGLVTNFGELCDATVQQAMQDMDAYNNNYKKSVVARQICANLKDDLYSEMGDVLRDQLQLLQMASFEAFRRDLSQLKVSPTLAQDMNSVVSKSLVDFAKALKKMQIPGSGSALQAAKTEFARSLREFCAERLLAARASGAYRPASRKGVTVGFHWLLPKPFGNDFRQEPWMVHATDNLVYVPQDKLTDVSEDEVRAGNWRRKIVPSPASREMTFMQ